MVSCPILGGSEELFVQEHSRQSACDSSRKDQEQKTDDVLQAGLAAEQPGGMKGRVHIQVVCIESENQLL